MRERGWIRRRVALDGIDRLRHSFRRGEITEPPPGHRVGFAESVDGDGQIVRFFRKRRDADVLGVVVNELFVNFVRQNVNVLAAGDFDNRLQFFAGVNRPGWIARAIHDQHFRPRRHRILEIFRTHLPIVTLHRRHDHRFGANQSHHVGITNPVGRGNNHFVARLAGGENCVVTGMLGAVAHDHLTGAISEPVVGR